MLRVYRPEASALQRWCWHLQALRLQESTAELLRLALDHRYISVLRVKDRGVPDVSDVGSNLVPPASADADRDQRECERAKVRPSMLAVRRCCEPSRRRAANLLADVSADGSGLLPLEHLGVDHIRQRPHNIERQDDVLACDAADTDLEHEPEIPLKCASNANQARAWCVQTVYDAISVSVRMGDWRFLEATLDPLREAVDGCPHIVRVDLPGSWLHDDGHVAHEKRDPRLPGIV